MTDIAKAAAFCVDVRHDIKTTIILANIAVTARFTSGGAEVREAQQNIKLKYKYNHSHNDTSIKFVMK